MITADHSLGDSWCPKRSNASIIHQSTCANVFECSCLSCRLNPHQSPRRLSSGCDRPCSSTLWSSVTPCCPSTRRWSLLVLTLVCTWAMAMHSVLGAHSSNQLGMYCPLYKYLRSHRSNHMPSPYKFHLSHAVYSLQNRKVVARSVGRQFAFLEPIAVFVLITRLN